MGQFSRWKDRGSLLGCSVVVDGRSPSGRAVVNGAAGVSALRASVPSAVFAISSSACFYPEEDDPENFDGQTFTWTFEIGKNERPGPGLYRIELVRLLTPEERSEKSATLLAQAIEARRAETGTGSVHESAVAKPCAQPPQGPSS
jgi:hypothetical protein